MALAEDRFGRIFNGPGENSAGEPKVKRTNRLIVESAAIGGLLLMIVLGGAVTGLSSSPAWTLDNPDNVIPTHDLDTLAIYYNTTLADIASQNFANASSMLETFGFVFQQFNLIPGLTNVENAELPMQLAGRSSADERRRALALLHSFGVDGLAKRFPGEISGGEQQRVTVARALANRPKLILADEPTASLDEVNSDAVLGLLRKVNEENEVAGVLTTTSVSDQFRSTRELSISGGTLHPL